MRMCFDHQHRLGVAILIILYNCTTLFCLGTGILTSKGRILVILIHIIIGRLYIFERQRETQDTCESHKHN